VNPEVKILFISANLPLPVAGIHFCEAFTIAKLSQVLGKK